MDAYLPRLARAHPACDHAYHLDQPDARHEREPRHDRYLKPDNGRHQQGHRGSELLLFL